MLLDKMLDGNLLPSLKPIFTAKPQRTASFLFAFNLQPFSACSVPRAKRAVKVIFLSTYSVDAFKAY